MMIKGKTYDALKFLAQIVLPALASAYFALAGIWGLPAAEQIVGTIVVVDTFLGAILQISSATFNAKSISGVMNVVDKPGGGQTVNLVLDGDPGQDLEGKKRAVFEVKEKK